MQNVIEFIEMAQPINQSIDRRITATDYIIKIQSKKWHTKFSSISREQAFEQKNKAKNMNTADN